MSSSAFEKIQYKASNGQVNLDEAQGIVECFVAGIGNKDSVGDICATGAFAKSLQRRKPRVVWGHNWNDPIGKVLEIYEVPVSDPRLPAKMKMAGIGGLYARVQFNLQSEKGREAFANVAFFGEEQEWSIGYKTIRAQYDQNLQANILYEVELYEVSPVLHGANQLTGTISVKSDEEKMHGVMPTMPTAPSPQTENIFSEGLAKPVSADKLAMLVAELSRRAGGPIKVVEATENSVTFIKPSKGKFRISYHFDGSEYMFGKPELLQAAEDKPMESGPTPIEGVEAKPNTAKPKPAAVAMPMPVAMKPGENGMVIVPLPPVKYEGDSSEREPVVVAEEQELADALVAITERHGKFNEDGTGVWAGYTPASENENADIGVKCANCVLYEGNGKCKIIAREVEDNGSCRFAVIPDNVVQVGDKKKRYMDAMDDSELDMVAELEEKYPGEFILGVVRGLAKRKRKRRSSRLYKSLDQFGIEEAELESKGLDPFLAQDSQYLIPVHPENAFEVKELLDPVLDYHRIDAFVNEEGIVIQSGLNYESKEALQNATKAAARRIGRSLTRGLGRAIGGRRGRGMGMPGGDLDPRTRRDTDLDGTLFDGFVGWEQPDPTPSGPGSIDNPKPSRRQLADKPSLSSGKRDVRRHATRTADTEKAIPDQEEDAKRAAHERIADKWEADGHGWSVVPKSGLYKNESSDFHRGIEIGHNQARLMWAGDANRKRPKGFSEKAKASNAYSDWHMSFAQAASRYMDANKNNSDTWRGISTQLRDEVATKMPDMGNWDADRRRDYMDSLNRLGFSSGKKGKKKTPRQSWNDASRQDFADRNILRSRKVPKKRREGPTADEFSSGKKLKNLNDRNGEPFYVGNERITEEEMSDVVREDEFYQTVLDASFDELVEVTGLSDRQAERILQDIGSDGYADGRSMSLDEAENFAKDDLISELSTEEKLQIVLDKDFNGDKQALSRLIDEVFDRQLNDRIGAYENRREAGFGSGRRINTEGSSAIASANYNEENGTFDVEFKNGSRYRYSDVDAADVEAFEAADSKGRAFADFRKKYTAERLSGPRERVGMSSGRRDGERERTLAETIELDENAKRESDRYWANRERSARALASRKKPGGEENEFGFGRRVNTQGSFDVSSASYDYDTAIFDVEFADGRRLRHQDVLPEDIEFIENASDKDRAFRSVLKNYRGQPVSDQDSAPSGRMDRENLSSARGDQDARARKYVLSFLDDFYGLDDPDFFDLDRDGDRQLMNTIVATADGILEDRREANARGDLWPEDLESHAIWSQVGRMAEEYDDEGDIESDDPKKIEAANRARLLELLDEAIVSEMNKFSFSSGRRDESAEQFYSPANFSPEDNMKIVERMRGTSAFADLDEAQNNVDAEVRRMGRRVPGSIVDVNEREANRAFMAARREEITQMINDGEIKPLRDMAEISSGRGDQASSFDTPIDWNDRVSRIERMIEENRRLQDAAERDGDRTAWNKYEQMFEVLDTRLSNAKRQRDAQNAGGLSSGKNYWINNPTPEQISRMDADRAELERRFNNPPKKMSDQKLGLLKRADFADVEDSVDFDPQNNFSNTVKLDAGSMYGGEDLKGRTVRFNNGDLGVIVDHNDAYERMQYEGSEGGYPDDISVQIVYDKDGSFIDENHPRSGQGFVELIVGKDYGLNSDRENGWIVEDADPIDGVEFDEYSEGGWNGFSSGRPDERQSFEDFARSRFEESGVRGSFQNWMRRNEDDLSADWDNLQADMRGDGFSSGSREIVTSDFSIRVGGDRYEGGKFKNVSFYAPQDFVDRWAKQNAREILSAQDMRVSGRRGDTPDVVIARESTDELLGRIARSSRYDGNAERLQDDVNDAYRELSEQRRIEGQEAAMSEAFSSGARDGDGEMPDPFGPFSDRRIVEARMNGATLDELAERLRIPRTEVRRREQLFLHGLRDEKNSDRAIFERRQTGETLDSISQDLKISREEIRQRELRYMAKLRKAKEAPRNPLEGMQDGFSSGKEKKTREEVLSEIQKTLIAMLETADPKDWSPPWSRVGSAYNPTTGKRYTGINPLLLSFTEATKGYKSPMWATFKQWEGRGAKVNAGEKATWLYRPTFKSVTDEKTGEKKMVSTGYTVFPVFNLEQTTGLKESDLLGEQLSPEQRVADLEEGLMEVGAVIETGGDSAYYSPSKDSITMPAFETFRDPESYYAVLAHEMVHWSGHSDRLNRPNLNSYGTPAYAQEELVAEIASAMILGLLGVTAEPREDHAQYLKGWLRALTEDPEALSKAFAEAEKAADFVIGKSPKLKAKSAASKADGVAPNEPALSSGRRLWTARERAENAFSEVMRDINENGSIARSGARGSIGRNDVEKMIKSSYGVDADYLDGNILIPSDSKIRATGMSPDDGHSKFLSAMRTGMPAKYTMDQDGPSTWAHSPHTGEGISERILTSDDGKSPRTFASEFGLNQDGPAGKWEMHTDSTERTFFTRGSSLGRLGNRWITHTTPDGKLVAYHEVVDGFISGDGEGQDIDFDYDFDAKLTPEFNSIEELDQYIDSYEKARRAFADEVERVRNAGDMDRLSELLDDEMVRSQREYQDSISRMDRYTLSSGARNVAIAQVDAGKARFTDDQWRQYNADIANVLKTDEPNFSSGRRTREDLIDPSEITNVREMMNRTDELGANSRAIAGNLNYSKDPYDFETIKAGSPVKFKYKGKDRTVYPTTLLAGKDGGVYFVGLDDEIGQYRSFRLDKIEGLIDGARPPLNRRLARRGRADELSSGARRPVERDATDRVPPMVQEKNEFLNKQDVMSENAQPSTVAENAFQLVEERERLIADLIKQNNIKTTDRTNITDLTDDEEFWDVLDDLDESIKNHIDWLDERQSEWEDRVGMVDFTSWRRETNLKNASNLIDEARFSNDQDDRRVALRDAIDALMEPRADGETRAIESASEITDAENPLEKARELLASEISVAEQEYRDFEARGENFSSEDVYPKRLRRPHEIANGAYGRDRYMSTPGLSSGRRVERMALDFEERGRLSKIMNEAANKFVIDSNGRRISGGPKVGNISENATRKPDGPWMLSFDKLRDFIRDGNGEELSTKDLAKLFGITESQAQMLDTPGAAIDQATVFSFFDITPSTQMQAVVSERILRDIWGWDSYPYWYDPLDWDRGPLTRAEYDDLVDQKEMPDGLLFPADFDPYQEIETESGVSILDGPRALSAVPQSKLFEAKFGIKPFLNHMGIPEDATEDEIRSALTVEVDGVEYIPTPDQMRRWRERGIPTGIIEQMVESGLIPNAGEVFGPIGEQFDREIKRNTALQRIVDMAKGSGKMKSMRRLGLALGDQKLERTLATKPKFSLQTTGKADRNRVDRSEVERMLDNVNRAIGTEFTIDDFTAGLPEAQRQGFSSGRKAAEEIASVGDQLTAKLSGRSRPNRGAPARITPKMQDELIYWAKNKGSWSGFAKSLVKQLEANGFLTESQWSKLLNLHDSEVRKRFNKR